MGLLAFSALTIDLGSLWVARAQAQNAADAGGAGRRRRARLRQPDRHRRRPQAAAQADRAAAQHLGRAGGAGLAADGRRAVPDRLAGRRRRLPDVAVSRGTASGTPLPVFFSRLFGVDATDVRRLGQRQGHARQRGDLSAAAGHRRSLERPASTAPVPIDDAWTATTPRRLRRHRHVAAAGARPTRMPADAAAPAPDARSPAGAPSMTFRLTTPRSRAARGRPAARARSPRGPTAQPGRAACATGRTSGRCTACRSAIGASAAALHRIAATTRSTAAGAHRLGPGADWDGTGAFAAAHSASVPRLITIARRRSRAYLAAESDRAGGRAGAAGSGTWSGSSSSACGGSRLGCSSWPA